MRAKNVKIVVQEKDGATTKSRLSYNQCLFYYNDQTGSFLYRPWDMIEENYYGDDPKGNWKRVNVTAESIEYIYSFTDIIDAVKLIFGSKEFNFKRVHLLWDAYRGKHNLYQSNNAQYFFPIKK